MKSLKSDFEKEVVFFSGIESRAIPGYMSAYAGVDGRIRCLSSSGKVHVPTQYEYKSTKGTYLYVKVINDSFSPVIKAVHKLVCLAWHTMPLDKDQRYDPNHKDGDKHNNRPSNLEWMTPSSNVQHAYNTGLTTQGLRVEVLDVISGEKKTFHTLSHFSRAIGIGRNVARDVIARHRKVPWNGQYLFVLDDTADRKVERHQRTPVVFKDYLSNDVRVCDSYTKASELTGVKLLSLRYNAVSGSDNLLSGYVFRLPKRNDIPFPEYSIEEVTASLEKYPRPER